ISYGRPRYAPDLQSPIGIPATDRHPRLPRLSLPPQRHRPPRLLPAPPLVGAPRPLLLLPTRLPLRSRLPHPQKLFLLPHQLHLPPRALSRLLSPLHPFSLIVLLSLLAAWLFLYSFRPSDQAVVVAGRTFSDREVLGILVVSTIVVVFLTSVGSLLISALLVGLAVVCTHGAFRMPEDLFLDEQEPLNSGFLSFLGGAASSAAAAAAPAVASRV
ncbi:UNVERIFIED_CONTAM: PRA1 family protein B3, partial [Sesamum latifolium]